MPYSANLNIVVASNREEDIHGILRVLEQAGYAVTGCEKTQDLIELLTSIQPEIVFLDYDLDEGEGTRAVCALHMQPGFHSLFLIFVLPKSADVPEVYSRARLENTGFLTRPFGKGEVLAFVEHIQRRRSESDAKRANGQS